MTDIAALTIGSTVIDFFFIYYLSRYANCFKGVFCGSDPISLSFKLSIQLTLLLTHCSLFISMASIPTLSAIRIMKCCHNTVCDNRIVGAFVFGVEAYKHCLLKIPLNVTFTLARRSLWKMCCRDRIYLSWDEYNKHKVESRCSTIRKRTRIAEGFKAIGPLLYELDMRPNVRNTHRTLKVFDVSIKVKLLEIH